MSRYPCMSLTSRFMIDGGIDGLFYFILLLVIIALQQQQQYVVKVFLVRITNVVQVL